MKIIGQAKLNAIRGYALIMEKSLPFPSRDPNWSQVFRSGRLFCGDIVDLRKLYHPYHCHRFVAGPAGFAARLSRISVRNRTF
jgi:hypothetical protein